MISVDKLIDDLIQREGGYVNHPNDRGGPTNWGITLSRARAYGYLGDIRSLPREKAAEIYKKNYWYEPKFDLVAKRNNEVANELFDTGVNMGPQTASKFLQRALNGLNKRGLAYADVTVDGAIGNMTLHALDELYKTRGLKGWVVLLRLLDAQQAVRYLELTEKDPSQEDFLFGWILNRVGG